ncbi:MAG TPA: translation initiation factor IF-2 [Candidatus Paceibacterota bacterium]|nr:translation initiation factor IF-2 [Candidatus Paceibacterota bacterium]
MSERPPIIVIMGHVDHGKSTLLDYIRNTNIVATEAGGITQHISAYEVDHKTPTGEIKRITFLDTPGHQAFTGMRARGAKVADIAVLVVSAEDGVKAQTIEAYKAIKEAGIPFVVAINKIDKPNANIEKTKQTLAEADILVEGYGGDISFAPISAKSGTGVDALLDLLLLTAELEGLTGEYDAPLEAVVIESRMDPKKGATATLIILNGTIKKGGFAVCEGSYVPLRVIENYLGKPIDSATFSSPIRITGWSSVPKVGATVTMVMTKKEAEAAATLPVAPAGKTFTANRNKDTVVIPLIIRTDVAGTLEAIEGELAKFSHERVQLRIISKGVGNISENDAKLAVGAEGAVIIAFGVKTDPLAAELILRNNVPAHDFNIIYKLTEFIDGLIKERAPHVEVKTKLGELKVLRFFSEQKDKQVLGGRVESGKITRDARFTIMRRGVEIGEGRVLELQQSKMKSPEVLEGNDCGLMVEARMTIAERDILVPFIIERKQ